MRSGGGTRHTRHVDTQILRSGEEMADINRDYRDDTNLSLSVPERRASAVLLSTVMQRNSQINNFN